MTVMICIPRNQLRSLDQSTDSFPFSQSLLRRGPAWALRRRGLLEHQGSPVFIRLYKDKYTNTQRQIQEHEGIPIGLDCQVPCTSVYASKSYRFSRHHIKLASTRIQSKSHSFSLSMSVITTVIFRARLYLAQSEVGDSGNYTCVCDQNLKQTVRLVVTLGKPQSEWWWWWQWWDN